MDTLVCHSDPPFWNEVIIPLAAGHTGSGWFSDKCLFGYCLQLPKLIGSLHLMASPCSGTKAQTFLLPLSPQDWLRDASCDHTAVQLLPLPKPTSFTLLLVLNPWAFPSKLPARKHPSQSLLLGDSIYSSYISLKKKKQNRKYYVAH